MKQQLNTSKILPKKSLGQNFIQDSNFILKLSSLITTDSSTNIFEIGPGKGALTKVLTRKKFKNLILIEKDVKLFNELKEKYKDRQNIIPINCDFCSWLFAYISHSISPLFHKYKKKPLILGINNTAFFLSKIIGN